MSGPRRRWHPADLPIDRPVATLMLLLTLAVLGTVGVFRLPLDFMPAVERPTVAVEVPFPGSHPLEGLREVAEPLEEEIATIPGVQGIRASSEQGSVRVRAEFDWDDEIDLKKMEVREAVERVRPDLPSSVGWIRIRGFVDGPGEGSILTGRISASRDLSGAWDLLDRRIKRPSERNLGVASVTLEGVEPYQVRIDLDPEALRRHNLDPADVVAALQTANVDADLGAVRGGGLRYGVRLDARFRSVPAIAALPVGGDDLRLGDVADVAMREPELDYGRHLDREFAIGIDVFREPTANTVATTEAILARIAEIERDPHLEGIKLLVWNNAGEQIKMSLRGLRNAGIYGGLLATAVLFFFLRKPSTTGIAAVAIPFSLLVTCGAMYALGADLNVLTMLGLMLGVGMLVDNAVVVMENIFRLEGEGMPPREAARTGVRQVAMAVVAATATTVCVWSWLFVAETSPMTIYLGEMALTICLAVGCSLLVSLTFIPLAAARWVPATEVRPGWVLRRLVPAYRRVLAWTLHHRAVTLAGLLLVAVSAAYPIAKVEKSAEPKQREDFFQIRIRPADPVTVEQMESYVDRIEAIVAPRREELGYDSLYSFYSERGFGLVRLYLAPEDVSEEAIAGMREAVDPLLPIIPGVELETGQEEWWRHGGGRRRMVSVALHGEDPEFLNELAGDVERRMRTVEGVTEVWGPGVQGQLEARVIVDPERARLVGATPRDVAEAVGLVYRGRSLRRFVGDDGELEMRFGLPEELQPGLASLGDLPVSIADGRTVPLESVATVEVARTDPRIEREDRKTTAWVAVEFPTELTTEDAQGRVEAEMAGVRLPEGYSWDWGRWGQDRDEGLTTMLEGVVLSLLVVILLMAALFESVTQPLAIVVTLPLAFFGAFWALWLGGYDLDVIGFMGLIILIGIVVNNGIVMVDHVNQLRRTGLGLDEALIRGCGDRLRPVLMTAITTLAGLLPLALSATTVAGAYVDSLAIVVIGGLATSTVFTLLALPVWVTTLDGAGRWLRSLLPRSAGPARPAERGVLAPGD